MLIFGRFWYKIVWNLRVLYDFGLGLEFAAIVNKIQIEKEKTEPTTKTRYLYEIPKKRHHFYSDNIVLKLLCSCFSNLIIHLTNTLCSERALPMCPEYVAY